MLRKLSLSLVAYPLVLMLSASVQAQWRTATPFSTNRYKFCQLRSPAYTGTCSSVVLTLENESLNVHFDTAESGLEGLTWGISSAPPEGSDVFPVVLVAERFAQRSVRFASGECRVTLQEVFCTTFDGLQQAVARQKVDERKSQ